MPTIKQKIAFKKTVENSGGIGKAMKFAGYGKTDTTNLTKSKGWKELVAQYFSDLKLAKKHNQLLNAKNENVQLGALKLGYEITGKIQQPLSQPQTTNILNINFFSNPKIKQATEKLDEAYKEYLINGDETKKLS